MADAVLSVRMDEGLKERFSELAKENGINNKDLMQILISQFELSQLASDTPRIQQDIEELQQITKRMNDIFIHMVERQKVKEQELKNNKSHQMAQLEEEVAKLTEQTKVLEEKEALIQKLKDELKDRDQKLKQTSEEKRNIKDLNDLLRDKNSKLEKTFSDQAAKLKVAEETLEEITRLKAKLEDQQDELHQQQLKIAQLNEEKSAVQKEAQTMLLKEKEAMANEMTLLQKTYELDLQEQKLALQTDYFKQLEQLKEEFEQTRLSLLAENTKIREELHLQLTKQTMNHESERL